MINNSHMTLYARGVDAQLEESWTRTVINNVLWIHENAVMDAIADNFVTVHIPTHGRTLPDMKPHDILVKGIVTQEIGVAGYTMRNLQLDYETVEIRNIKRHDYGSPGMQHIVIGAK